MACYNGCGGHGRCTDANVCACDASWKGYDCTESNGFMFIFSPSADMGLKRARERHASSDPIYHSEYLFFERAMRDGQLRTLDAHSAALSYVPTWIYYQVNNIAFATQAYQSLTRHMSGSYASEWKSTKPEQRVFFFSGDKGACGAPPGPLYISHWGLRVPWRHMSNPHDYKPGAYGNGNGPSPCADARHIVVPMVFRQGYAQLPAPAEPPYRCVLFFSGSITRREGYSQGVRKLVWDATRNATEDMCVLRGHVSSEYFRRSKFCLAASGDGFGSRLFRAAFHGCVPVFIQPSVTKPFEDLLPYDRFSLDVATRDIPRLRDILLAVSPERHREMRREWQRWRPALSWHDQAYEFTRYALCLRARTVRCDHLVPALLKSIGRAA